MQSPAASTLRAQIANPALLALGLAPMLLMIYTVIRLWLPLPFWDEWSTPGANLVDWSQGKLTFQELFSQHNESRKLFPRLLYLGLAQLGGWDVRKEMSITLLFVGTIAFLFYRLLRQTPSATRRAALTAWIAATFLCFSPVQLQNFLWGVQLEVFFPGLAVLALIAVNLSKLPLERKALLNGLLAFVATYTVAHGMLLWVLGIPLLAAGETISARRRFLNYGSYCLCGAGAVTAYFVGYHRPPDHPEMLAGNPSIPDLAHYLMLWVGSYFSSTIARPFAVGLTSVSVLLAALLTSMWVIRKQGHWRAFYAPFLVIAYAAATAAITAVGRIGFGINQALDGRYRTYSLFFYLGIVALLFALYCSYFRARTVARRVFLAATTLAAVAGAVSWGACFYDSLAHRKMVENRNRVLLRAVEWIDVIPDNPDFHYLFPITEILSERVRTLRRKNILRLPFISPQLAAAARQTPHPRNGDSFGQLETCVIDSNHNLWITGRAQLPNQGQPPDCIIIGATDAAHTYKPISIMETRRPRGGRKSKAPQEERLLFGRTIGPANLPPGDVTIAAWAVDLQSEKLYPLAGVTIIRAEQR